MPNQRQFVEYTLICRKHFFAFSLLYTEWYKTLRQDASNRKLKATAQPLREDSRFQWFWAHLLSVSGILHWQKGREKEVVVGDAVPNPLPVLLSESPWWVCQITHLWDLSWQTQLLPFQYWKTIGKKNRVIMDILIAFHGSIGQNVWI